MSAECSSSTAEPENLEANKCEGWESFSWIDLQAILAGERTDLSLFGSLKNLVEQSPMSVIEFLSKD
jgi:hypothetical protein